MKGIKLAFDVLIKSYSKETPHQYLFIVYLTFYKLYLLDFFNLQEYHIFMQKDKIV